MIFLHILAVRSRISHDRFFERVYKKTQLISKFIKDPAKWKQQIGNHGGQIVKVALYYSFTNIQKETSILTIEEFM